MRRNLLKWIIVFLNANKISEEVLMNNLKKLPDVDRREFIKGFLS
jgi:hypothetical protein